jgi:hypothetical protein
MGKLEKAEKMDRPVDGEDERQDDEHCASIMQPSCQSAPTSGTPVSDF